MRAPTHTSWWLVGGIRIIRLFQIRFSGPNYGDSPSFLLDCNFSYAHELWLATGEGIVSLGKPIALAESV